MNMRKDNLIGYPDIWALCASVIGSGAGLSSDVHNIPFISHKVSIVNDPSRHTRSTSIIYTKLVECCDEGLS